MQVPIIYAEAVIGPNGARIDYIRRASRSSILINDLEGGAMSIEINGSSATDVQTAEQLIKVTVTSLRNLLLVMLINIIIF